MEELFLCYLCKKPMFSSSGIASCSFCGKKEKADYVCLNRHYVCEECRLDSPDRLVKRVCEATQEIDPMKIALLLMKHPAIPMHGPEHHYLISCILLAAMRNAGKFDIDSSKFDEAIRRGKRILYGSCALYGVCGTAAGVGVAVSIATGASVMSNKERSASMQVVSETLKEIAKVGGPRCCKASTFKAIENTTEFLKRNFDVNIIIHENPRPCEFAPLNNDCIGERCPYHR